MVGWISSGLAEGRRQTHRIGTLAAAKGWLELGPVDCWVPLLYASLGISLSRLLTGHLSPPPKCKSGCHWAIGYLRSGLRIQSLLLHSIFHDQLDRLTPDSVWEETLSDSMERRS